MTKNNDIGLLVLRIALSILMLLHGVAKLQHGLGYIQGLLTSYGLPTFISYGVYVGEIIAPLTILLGYRTRLASAIYAFTCVVAILLAHNEKIFQLGNRGEWAVELLGLYLAGAITLFFTGAGKYAFSTKNNWD
ncbi:DoxX family protein [Myroides injenensis]|uniref:DoxX family protein n=1 Tax=Myroides injenensis TaxID=1183151 RepID=UPI000289F556|nr:DoxX family protein [Myroides injenensis]